MPLFVLLLPHKSFHKVHGLSSLSEMGFRMVIIISSVPYLLLEFVCSCKPTRKAFVRAMHCKNENLPNTACT